MKFTGNDAIDAGHDLVMHRFGEEYLPECERVDTRERCFTFAPTSDVVAAHRRWLEHAAEDAGVCPACMKPDDRRNRLDCYRCWVMFWADQGVLPRDAPKWHGPAHSGETRGASDG